MLGAGTIGLVTLQAARLAGIPYVGVLELSEERRAQARALGADEVFGDVGEAAEAIGGMGADLVLDAVGAQATRAAALELVRAGGRAVYVGLAADDTTLGFHDVVRRQLTLQGSYAYTMDDYDQAHEWLVSGQASLGDLPDVLPLEDGPEMFARLAKGPPPAQVKVFLAGAGRGA